jgi:hypothetical protein
MLLISLKSAYESVMGGASADLVDDRGSRRCVEMRHL